MMFIPTSEIDTTWKRIQALHANGKLTGIEHVQRAPSNEDDDTLISFFCSGDESEVKSYAENLIDHVPYYPRPGYMYYKTNLQTKEGIYSNDPLGRPSWKYRLKCPLE